MKVEGWRVEVICISSFHTRFSNLEFLLPFPLFPMAGQQRRVLEQISPNLTDHFSAAEQRALPARSEGSGTTLHYTGQFTLGANWVFANNFCVETFAIGSQPSFFSRRILTTLFAQCGLLSSRSRISTSITAHLTFRHHFPLRRGLHH